MARFGALSDLFASGSQVGGCDGEMDAAALKLWVMTALLDEGFGFHMAATL